MADKGGSTSAAVDDAHVADERLLRDALDLDADAAVALLSREPLAEGSVAGFSVTSPEDGDPVVYYVDTSRRAVDLETGFALVDDDGSTEARVWLHPADPHLPALAPAAFDHAAATLLSRAGLESAGAPVLIAYRPGRRAVLRAATADGAVWVKVVRPNRVARIVELHAALAGRGIPVPDVRAWSPEGLIVMTSIEGEPAIEADVDPDLLLDSVDRLRAAIANVELAGPARTGLAARVDWYASRLTDADHARARELARALARAFADESERPQQAVHGDLHLGQLFVSDDASAEIVGVIDVDTAGIGDPADDVGAFVAHAIASALLSRGMPGAERVRLLAERSHARWSTDAASRSRTCAHLLGHAVAAIDVGDRERTVRLLSIAEALMAGAEEPLVAITSDLAAHKGALTSGFDEP